MLNGFVALEEPGGGLDEGGVEDPTVSTILLDPFWPDSLCAEPSLSGLERPGGVGLPLCPGRCPFDDTDTLCERSMNGAVLWDDVTTPAVVWKVGNRTVPPEVDGTMPRGTGGQGTNGTRGNGLGTRGAPVGIRGAGLGTRGAGLGTRGAGLGTRGAGLCTRGAGLGTRGAEVGTRGVGLGNRGVGLGTRGLDEIMEAGLGTRGAGLGTIQGTRETDAGTIGWGRSDDGFSIPRVL